MPAATHELAYTETIHATGEQSSPCKTSSVLVVDDTAFGRRTTGLLIEKGLGRPVRYAENGEAALEDIARSMPCAIVTDLHMPVMDGLALVKAIRQSYPQIPVILMTAYGSAEVAMQALKAGAASYVGKADLARSLVETLEQILEAVDCNQKLTTILKCQTSKRTEFRIENDPDLIAPMIGMIKEDLGAFQIGDVTTRTRISVALQESLANALYHGNLECSSDLRQDDERVFYSLADERRKLRPYRNRMIQLEVSLTVSQARFVITDEGPGFDISSLDKPFDPEDLLRIGGRGMLLIRTFMDEAIHNSTGNQITLIKNA